MRTIIAHAIARALFMLSLHVVDDALAALAGQASGERILEDGVGPRALARVDSVRMTPAPAIIASAVLVWVLTVSGTFVYLLTFSVIARMLMYASTCVALVTLRRRDGAAPIAIPGGPVWAVIAVICCIVVLATATGTARRDVSIALAAGWVVRMGVRAF